MFRPFPSAAVVDALKSAKKVAILDRNCSFGVGGIFAQEIRAALQNQAGPKLYSYIAGLGGRDVTPETIESMYISTRDSDTPKAESVWLGLNEELLK